MPSLVRARGLHTNHNELALPEGALREADNVNIDENDVISPRNGFGQYGDSFPIVTDRVKQLAVYKNRILRHYGTTLQFDSDGSGTFSNFTGSYSELIDGLRIKYIEQNGNFFFTTNDGIKKISATSASQFSTATNYIKDAGVAKGLDVQASLNTDPAGFLTVDNQVAYRILWGYTDANSNLLLGSPSERTILINPAAGATSNVELTFTIPESVNTTDYFYQIYRTGLSGGEAIDPGDEMNLVYEESLTSTDISNGYVTLQYEDYPDSFREASNLLYTNEISGDGILQANDRPPVAHDITSFKESLFYANTKTLHRRIITLLSASALTAGTTKFCIGSEDVYVEYNAETTEDVEARDFKVFTAGSISQNIYDTAKSLIHVINRDNNCDGTITVNSYTGLTTDTITINGVVLAEGTDWDAITSNNTTAESIKNAINNDTTLGALVTATVGQKERTSIIAVADVGASLDGKYFLLQDENGSVAFWIDVDDSGTTIPAGASAADRAVEITTISTGDSATAVGTAVYNAIIADSKFEAYKNDLNGRVVVQSSTIGNKTDGADGDTTFTIAEDLAGNDNVITVKADNAGLDYSYLMSTTDPTNLTVDSRLICSPVVAYYTSGAEDLPGQMTFEAKTLSDEYIDFGIKGTSGSAFNPTLPSALTITSITNASSPVVTTSAAHSYSDGDVAYVNSEDTVPIINKSYTVTVLTTTTFSIEETITTGASTGTTFKSTVFSDNEDAPNRIYFSKTSQPEAVPQLNWLDVGAKDSAIQRIVALRDNLFVLKTDAIYVVSGTSAPNFSVRLLDNSVTIKAPDTATVLNNQIFVLTNQGIANVSDSGVAIISRVIENLILSVTNARFTDFETQSFGVGYESQRAYHIWLPTKTSDTYATQCFRYNTFNQTWTRWVKTCNCGVVNAQGDDKMYLGAGDGNYILQERKDEFRSDFADLEYNTTIAANGVDGTRIELSSLSNVEVGDSLYQSQYVTISRFNGLLRKLDLDIGLDSDYYSSLVMSQGDSPYTSVQSLITKLNADDSGQTYTWDNPSTFSELMTTYNNMIGKLNESIADTLFKNYRLLSTAVEYEAVILDKTIAPNSITVSLSVPFIEGPVSIFKGYEKRVVWAPQHFGDASIWKQVREGSLFFDGNTITNAKYGFATDFSPSFEKVEFNGLGLGAFGSMSFGDTAFGGDGTDKPIRMFVPRQKMRCRHISSLFEHINAREDFRIVGMSYTIRPFSSRAYRTV